MLDAGYRSAAEIPHWWDWMLDAGNWIAERSGDPALARLDAGYRIRDKFNNMNVIDLETDVEFKLQLLTDTKKFTGSFSCNSITHYSIIPLFHYSIIPLFHYSIIPLFHYSITAS